MENNMNDMSPQELCKKLEKAETQPLSEKRSAEEVFSEKRELLEKLLKA